jgi:hypothetical protein
VSITAAASPIARVTRPLDLNFSLVAISLGL